MDENTNPQVPGNTTTKSDMDTDINADAKPDADIKADSEPGSHDFDGDVTAEKVFDITPDLNISPINEMDDNDKSTFADNSVIQENVPSTPLQQAMGKIGAIPLKNIDEQPKKAQTLKVVSNPPLNNQTPSVNIHSPTTIPANTNPKQNANNQPVVTGQTKPAVNIGENGSPVIKPLTDAEKFSKKALRTYEGDIAEFMSHKGTSSATIAIAENIRQEKGETINNDKSVNLEERTHKSKKILLVIISVILVGGGIVGAYYFYIKSALGPKTVVTQTNPNNVSPITSNSQVSIPIDNLVASQIISNIQTEIMKPQSPNTIKEIILTKKNNDQVVRVNSTDMINIMNIDAPNMLVRSLSAPWMLGEYSDANGNKDLFVVVTHNFFQNAFAGMLSWENVMADDLKQFFGNTKPVQTTNIIDNITSTSTPTKTASTSVSTQQTWQPYFTLLGHFSDGIIKNKDAREFRTDTGNVIFLYSFIDNTKLVITSRESTLAEILSRLEQQSFIR